MIKIRKGGIGDLPWCYWARITTKEAINIESDFDILVGEEYEPREFKEPHIILLKNDSNLIREWLGDFCYISVSDNPVILKGEVDKDQLKLIKAWIIKHTEPIMRMWSGEFDSGNFCEAVGITYD